jgi:hypothetical protein
LLLIRFSNNIFTVFEDLNPSTKKNKKANKKDLKCTAGLKHLRTLDLIANQISEVKGHAFEGLKNLETLSLCQNSVLKVHTNAFTNLKKIYELDLAFLPLKYLSYDFLPSNIKMLRKLDLTETRIEDEPIGAAGPKKQCPYTIIFLKTQKMNILKNKKKFTFFRSWGEQ